MSIHWRAAAWLLSKKDPLRYGREGDDRGVIRRQMVVELIDFLQRRISAGAFEETMNALAAYGDAELDASALPCPGLASDNDYLRAPAASQRPRRNALQLGFVSIAKRASEQLRMLQFVRVSASRRKAVVRVWAARK